MVCLLKKAVISLNHHNILKNEKYTYPWLAIYCCHFQQLFGHWGYFQGGCMGGRAGSGGGNRDNNLFCNEGVWEKIIMVKLQRQLHDLLALLAFIVTITYYFPVPLTGSWLLRIGGSRPVLFCTR